MLYPVFLSLEKVACIIVGFGNVGRRKFADIKLCEPLSISIFDPHPTFFPAPEPKVLFYPRPCEREDIKNSSLVFACANDAEENARIAEICEEMGIFCDSASDPKRGSFIVPAVVRAGDLALAISSSGASPALVRKWKDELYDWLNSRASMAWLMRELRPLILSAVPEQESRKILFYKLIDSPIADALESGDEKAFHRSLDCLEELLPFLNRDDLAIILERVWI